MELSSTNADITKTDLVDNNGAVVYRITTNMLAHLKKIKTTIAHFEPGVKPDDSESQPTSVAEIEWHSVKDDTVTCRGRQYEAQSFMPNHGITTAKREFKATSGRAYYWMNVSLHTANGVEVARWHDKLHGNRFRHTHEAYLYVADLEILDDLDEIILVMVYHLVRYAQGSYYTMGGGTQGEQAMG